MDPSMNVEFFSGAKNFNIRNGRFRTVAGNSYTGYHPPPVPLPSPPQEQPSINSRTSFFHKSSNFEIGGGEFAAIDGDAIDILPSFGPPGPGFDEGYYDPNQGGSFPQMVVDQGGPDFPAEQASRERPEDTGQMVIIPDHTGPLDAPEDEGEETVNMAPSSVDIPQANDAGTSSISHPGMTHGENTPSQGRTSQAVPPRVDAVVEPTLLISPLAQADNSAPVPVGDDAVHTAKIQGSGNVSQSAEPRSQSGNPNHPETSPRIVSPNLDGNGSGASEKETPSRVKRFWNWIKNIARTLWHRLPFVSGSHRTGA